MSTNKLKFGTETPTKLYMGATEVTKAYMGETLVYEKSSSEQDALAGTWLFNDSLNNVSSIETNVNFTSSNTDFIGIKIEVVLGPGPSEIYMWYKNSDNSLTMAFITTIAESNTWKDEAYKTITITSKLSEVTNGDQLLAFLQSNATKQ